ncbi:MULTISPECIES: YajQ family cyclic di-GMP-binding protein [unclassified Ectothiorhodospira]|uniref:YajQ family cyclic di-GMP-binding protein n=1 Tax=unclassified Ectothiorhodospira TaxID=2684909 RepID=UPI001EE94EAE|nr:MULTISPECIES: YajQ family cyclic di-GMP-binding protein [unclassified Ectothiorhodospira]MCG5514596.1 YajQ family cyclic di-GMP-binding protein [Ectothiorhodospira sp. 9100]MCG5518030.1 YajQ family cyclic di-GMP-binding protein [Ectothiorhodospira sp. 9905]
MPSFDVVSEVDMQELRNAVDQTRREVENRYDFKGSAADVEQSEAELTLFGDSEFQVDQVMDILTQKMAKRGIDVSCLDSGKLEEGGGKARRIITIRQGIDQDMGKKIIRLVKDSKLKVQASIQGDKVRITGKKRDDLQDAIALLRKAELDLPLQYDNFRD